MKTPIPYYGGQQKMLKDILPLIPPHNLYNEPFAGGAALLFAKQPAKINIINDLNGELVNFYKTTVTDFKALKKEIRTTLHSRENHKLQIHIRKSALFLKCKTCMGCVDHEQIMLFGRFHGGFFVFTPRHQSENLQTPQFQTPVCR